MYWVRAGISFFVKWMLLGYVPAASFMTLWLIKGGLSTSIGVLVLSVKLVAQPIDKSC